MDHPVVQGESKQLKLRGCFSKIVGAYSLLCLQKHVEALLRSFLPHDARTSAVLLSYVVRLSVTLYREHIGWTSSKLIT